MASVGFADLVLSLSEQGSGRCSQDFGDQLERNDRLSDPYKVGKMGLRKTRVGAMYGAHGDDDKTARSEVSMGSAGAGFCASLCAA